MCGLMVDAPGRLCNAETASRGKLVCVRPTFTSGTSVSGATAPSLPRPHAPLDDKATTGRRPLRVIGVLARTRTMTTHRPCVAVVARLWRNAPISPSPASPVVVHSRQARERSRERVVGERAHDGLVLGRAIRHEKWPWTVVSIGLDQEFAATCPSIFVDRRYGEDVMSA